MRPNHFKKIDRFFSDRRKTELIPFAYSIFVENVTDRETRFSGNVDESQMIEICESYLTDAQLTNYLAVAEKQFDATTGNSKTKTGFWWSVLSSILANLIFVLAVYAIYVSATKPTMNAQIDAATAGSSEEDPGN